MTPWSLVCTELSTSLLHYVLSSNYVHFSAVCYVEQLSTVIGDYHIPPGRTGPLGIRRRTKYIAESFLLGFKISFTLTVRHRRDNVR